MATTITVTSAGYTSITVKAQSNYYGASVFGFYLDGSYKWSGTSTTSTNGYYYQSYTFSGLSPNTSYTIKVNVDMSGGGNVENGEIIAKTTSPTTSISKTSSTTASITMKATCSYDGWYYNWYKNGVFVTTTTSNTGSSSYTFSGLACGTSYDLKCQIKNSGGTSWGEPSSNVSTDACPAPTVTLSSSSTSSTIKATATVANCSPTSYKWYLGGSLKATTTSNSYTYSGLSCGNSYSCKVEVYNGTTLIVSDTETLSTATCVPTITLSQGTTTWNSIEVTASIKDATPDTYAWFKNSVLQTYTTTPSFTFSNLSCNTAYSISVNMYIGGPFGVLLDGDTKSMSTASCPIPSQPTNVSVDSVDGRTCIVKFAWPTDGSATEIDISLTNTSPYDDKGFTQIADITSFGVSLPNYNTVYTLYVRSYNSTWGTWSSPVSVTLTTGKPPTPSISFINKASNSITMQITAPSDRTSRLEMHMYIKGNGSPTEVQSVDTPTANQSYQFIFSNLTYGVIYVFYGQNFDYNADGITLVGSTYTTGISFLRPENFAWTTAKVKGQHFDLTDDEWNALTARINEFRTYKGLTNNTFVSAVTGNKLTAVMFNQVVNAINAMFPPTSPPSTVADPQPTDFSLRDKVTADRLNGLVTSLNSII